MILGNYAIGRGLCNWERTRPIHDCGEVGYGLDEGLDRLLFRGVLHSLVPDASAVQSKPVTTSRARYTSPSSIAHLPAAFRIPQQRCTSLSSIAHPSAALRIPSSIAHPSAALRIPQQHCASLSSTAHPQQHCASPAASIPIMASSVPSLPEALYMLQPKFGPETSQHRIGRGLSTLMSLTERCSDPST